MPIASMSDEAPETIRCSRHNDGEPFELTREKGSFETTQLVYTDLEQILSNRIMRMEKKPSQTMSLAQLSKSKGSKIQEQPQMQQQVFLCPRRDVAFLECSDMAPYHKIRTSLGILEDHQPPQVEIVCYNAKECKENQGPRIRCGPHSEWKRASVVAQDHRVENDSSSRSESTKMVWVDLREFQAKNYTAGSTSFLSTEAGVIQFLRSILSPSHDTSPWEAAAKSKESSGEQTTSSLPTSEMIVLVLNFPSNHDYENDFSLLKKFRVSDAAPSWFLHGHMHLEALEESLDEVFHLNTDEQDLTSTLSSSTLLIYKKLSPRRDLYTDNPATSEYNPKHRNEIKTGATEAIHSVVEKGCLWQEYEEEEGDEEDEKERGGDAMNVSEGGDDDKTGNRYRLVSPPYLNLDEEYPGANLCAKLFSKEALQIFTEDALSVPQWTPWPETAHYKVSSFGNEKPWTVFPLCYCFPANKPENLLWVPTTKAFVPRTCRLLEEALRYGDGQSYLRTALFSQMAPRSVLEEHTGWADLANNVLRLHIPLVVTNNSGVDGENDDLCGTWVDGCVETHAVGRPLLFDDSKIHRAFNYSDRDRIVLIVDLARPERLPLGTAESGHTEELDAFIAQMSVPK